MCSRPAHAVNYLTLSHERRIVARLLLRVPALYAPALAPAPALTMPATRCRLHDAGQHLSRSPPGVHVQQPAPATRTDDAPRPTCCVRALPAWRGADQRWHSTDQPPGSPGTVPTRESPPWHAADRGGVGGRSPIFSHFQIFNDFEGGRGLCESEPQGVVALARGGHKLLHFFSS